MYQIVISRSAEKDIENLPSAVVRKVGKAIDSLSAEPRPNKSKKLKASKENIWRIRVGDYRIIYSIDEAIRIIDVRKVGHRKDVYE